MGFDVERDGLLALRREADQLAARLGNAMRPDATYIGQDPSGAVRVTVDSAGRVVDIELDTSGTAHQTADQLGDAVLVAIEDAAGHRLRSWAEAVDGRDTTGAPPRPAPATDPIGTEDLLALLRQVDDQLDMYSRQMTDREANTHGPVSVTLRNGQVVGVRLDRQWFATASRPRIAAELKAAFDEAYRLIDDAPPPPGPIAELQAMTADFENLLRRLNTPDTRE